MFLVTKFLVRVLGGGSSVEGLGLGFRDLGFRVGGFGFLVRESSW